MQSFSDFVSNGNTQAPTGALPSFSEFVKTAPPVTDTPSLLSRSVTGITNYAVSGYNQSKNVLDSIVTHPIDTAISAGKGIVSSFEDPFKQGGQKIAEGLSQATSGLKLNPLNPTGVLDITNPNTIAGVAKVISGLAQGAFSPITGAFNIASKIPGLKQVAEAVNFPLTESGLAGSWATGKAIDWVPDSILSQQSKDVIKQPLQELGSLTAQTVLGGAIIDKIGSYASKGELITPETAQKIVDEAKIETQDHPAIKATESSTPTPAPLPTFKEFIQNPGGVEAPNTRAQTVMESMVEKKLADNVGDVPTHEVMNMKEQAKSALDFITQNKEEAMKIAMGDSNAPQSLKPESVYTAMEVKAMQEGDVQTLRDLVNSKIPTAAGQALKALDSINPDSPVKIMRDVQVAREAALEKQTGRTVSKIKEKTIKDMTEHIQKTAPTKQTWSDFIEQIKCNY